MDTARMMHWTWAAYENWALQEYDGPRFQRCEPCDVQWTGIDAEGCWNCGQPSMRRKEQLASKSRADGSDGAEVHGR